MTTFLEETREAIHKSGHVESDVMFIGSADGKYRLSWDEFAKISNFTYDNGFGGQEIAKDLIIYFKDQSYFVRGEYDGSEWWEYNEPKTFAEQDESQPYTVLCSRQKEDYSSWSSVEDLNKDV